MTGIRFSIIAAVLSASLTAQAQQLVARGMTEPVSDSTLGASVNGKVESIARREGESVKKGDIIIELESSVELLEVKRRKLVSDSKAKVNAADKRAETLRLDLESTRKLYEATKSISTDDLRKKELEYKLAEAELEGLQTEEEREIIEYQMATAQLDRKRVRAPFDGVVVKVFMEVGENCNQQQPLARVVNITKCQFTTHVESSLPWNLSQGDEVALTLQGNKGDVRRQGTVEYVSPVVDPSSGLQEVRVIFDNTDSSVRPGVNGIMTVIANDK